MKKTLLSVVAGVAVIGAANAGIKETCLEHPDKLVWVEKTQRCIPINPCKSDDETIQDVYCNKTFANVQLGDWFSGPKVVEAYVEKVLGLHVVDNRTYVQTDINVFGQDYVPCKTNDGGYVVFEFDDLNDWTSSDIYEGVVESACIIYNGEFSNLNGAKGGLFCAGSSEDDCVKIAKFATELISARPYMGTIISEYKETQLANTTKVSLCEFKVEK